MRCSHDQADLQVLLAEFVTEYPRCHVNPIK